MSIDNLIWVLSVIWHLCLLFLLMRHKLPKFTLLITFQIMKVPVIYYFHHHDLTNPYYWSLYKNIFCALRAFDIIFAFFAVNETMHTEYHWISRCLEIWLISQLILFSIVAQYTQYWAIGENISNAIYLLSCLIWIKLLSRPSYE